MVSKNDIDKLKKIVPPNLKIFYRIFLISKYVYFYGDSENLYSFAIHYKHYIKITHFYSEQNILVIPKLNDFHKKNLDIPNIFTITFFYGKKLYLLVL